MSAIPRTQQCCGSGSVLDPYSGASWIRIRIRIRNTDPEKKRKENYIPLKNDFFFQNLKNYPGSGSKLGQYPGSGSGSKFNVFGSTTLDLDEYLNCEFLSSILHLLPLIYPIFTNIRILSTDRDPQSC